MKSILWVVLLPNNCHHQDFTCLVGDPYEPSFATITGKGDSPKYPQHLHCCFVIFFPGVDKLPNYAVHLLACFFFRKKTCCFFFLDAKVVMTLTAGIRKLGALNRCWCHSRSSASACLSPQDKTKRNASFNG